MSVLATPNIGGVLRPRYLVMHYTAGRSLESSVASLRRPDAKASAHLVLGRDGGVVQLVPFNRVAWHAYTGAQIERALELAELLAAHDRLEDVIGHEDIAPGRTTDPGPAFPLQALRAQVAGRQSDLLSRRVVNAASLNIRRGPGAQHETLAPALKRGTELLLIEAGSRWDRVEVVGSADLEGWVANAFLAPAASPTTRAARKRGSRSVGSKTAMTASDTPETTAGRELSIGSTAGHGPGHFSARRSRPAPPRWCSSRRGRAAR